MKNNVWQLFLKLPQLLKTDPPDADQHAMRIRFMECHVGLPIRAVITAFLFYYIFYTRWYESDVSGLREVSLAVVQEVSLEALQRFFIQYLAFNVAAAILLLRMDQLSLKFTQWLVFAVALLDAILLGGLLLITGGFSSLLFWVFLGLIIRNSISVPPAIPQLILNLLTSLSCLLGGLLAALIDVFCAESNQTDNDPTSESFAIPMALLLLLTLCCYAAQVLLAKQRRAEEEAAEYVLRQEQLRVTGRLAAEIAHQLKNPLGIINNAAFNLQRNVKEGKSTITQQIRIIREEVERSDRIITDMMGYARLADGKLERLNVVKELESAIDRVFPPGQFNVKIHFDYGEGLPLLLMQRGHLSEIFINLLQNSREAIGGNGNITVSAHYGDNYSVVVTIGDDGPGISTELREKIFEPYFTTKEKGSGLGLAIVKHNIEIYGGSVRAECGLAKGSKFVLNIPAKSLMKLLK